MLYAANRLVRPALDDTFKKPIRLSKDTPRTLSTGIAYQGSDRFTINPFDLAPMANSPARTKLMTRRFIQDT